MSLEALKRDVEEAVAAQEWGRVSQLSAQIKMLQDGSPTLSPASSMTGVVRQTSNQEHSATLRARQLQREAEAEEAQLEGELSRTRAEFMASLRDGTPTPMSRPQLRQSISRVFDDEYEAQQQWNSLEPTISYDLQAGAVGFDDDLALEPLQWTSDDPTMRRALGSARKSFLERCVRCRRASCARAVCEHSCHSRLTAPLCDNPRCRNLSAELKREGSGGMSARNYGFGPMPTASADITIDTPVRFSVSDPRVCVCVCVCVFCVCVRRARSRSTPAPSLRSSQTECRCCTTKWQKSRLPPARLGRHSNTQWIGCGGCHPFRTTFCLTVHNLR